MRPAPSAAAPPTTTAATPIRITPDATAETCAVIRQTRLPRASSTLARRAKSFSTYGLAKLVRTSSCPWIDSSVTAARSDQASSSKIRIGPIACIRRRNENTSTAPIASMPTPAGHQTANAVTIDRVLNATDWTTRTPLARSSAPTW